MLVGLGAALMVSIPLGSGMADASRAVQGVATGIGFLCAGDILHHVRHGDERVKGLTSAASLWVTAAIGMVAAVGQWRHVIIGTIGTLLILVVMRPVGEVAVEEPASGARARPRLMRTTPASIKRCFWAGDDPLMIAYHDEEWGVPIHDDGRWYEKLLLDGAQAGLSWATILRKREGYRKAFAGFDPAKVARFTDKDVTRLMGDAGIVRNRLNILFRHRQRARFPCSASGARLV